MKGYEDPVVGNGVAKVGDSMVAIDNIRLDGLLGSGANAFTFSGDDLQLKRRVAVKVYPPRLGRPRRNPDRIEQAVAEAQKLANIKSDVIASVYHVSRLENHWPYVVMEYVEGEPLASVRERLNGAEGFFHRKVFWTRVHSGLDIAERLGVYHGDLHGGNVIVRWFHATLIDFGTSAFAGKVYSLKRHATKVNEFAQWLLPELQEYVPPFDIPNLVRAEYATHAVGRWVATALYLQELETLLPDISDQDLTRRLTSLGQIYATALIDLQTPVLTWLEHKGIPSESISAYSSAANAEVARQRAAPYPPTVGVPLRPVPPGPAPRPTERSARRVRN